MAQILWHCHFEKAKEINKKGYAKMASLRCGDFCFSFNFIGEREEESLDW